MSVTPARALSLSGDSLVDTTYCWFPGSCFMMSVELAGLGGGEKVSPQSVSMSTGETGESREQM